MFVMQDAAPVVKARPGDDLPRDDPPVARVDYQGNAGTFRTHRTLPPDVLAVWKEAVVRAAGPAPGRVLDLGAGTGGFLEPLADWFGAPVVAVEPSAAMRDEAARAGSTGRHLYVAAWAESLPLRTGSVDTAWLSTVIHQVDDRDQVFRELRRVVRPGGVVALRGFLADVPATGLLGAFPGTERVAATFPSTGEVVASCEGAGFTVRHVEDVVEPWRVELPAWRARARDLRHVDSWYRELTDAEIAEGLRSVEAAYAGVDGPIASDVTLRLLVVG